MIDKLHYISQATPAHTHLEAIEKVLISGGKWIQLRIKNQPEEDVLKLAVQANNLCKSYGATLIINDYPHIALAAGADGVHLGLDDLSIPEARSIVGHKMIIGGTANTFEHILQSSADGADYIGLGPFRFTHTKQNLSPIIGLQGYHKIMEQVRAAGISIPVIAIGGIESTDVPGLLNAGLYGVAVSGALTTPANTDQKLQELFTALNCSPAINQ